MKSERERQISHDVTSVWNLKKKRHKGTYLQNRNRLTGIENKFLVTERERGDKLGICDQQIHTTVCEMNNTACWIAKGTTRPAG